MQTTMFQAIGAGSLALTFCIIPALADDYNDGAAQYSAGNYAAAKKHFIGAVAAKPKSWQAHYQLANTFVALKDSENAKRSYVKCLSSNPPADIRANCERAVAYIASNPKLITPVAAPVAVSKRLYSSGTTATANQPSSGSTPASNVEAKRAQIMQEAEAEIAKFKEHEKQRLEELHNNSNEIWRHSDGSIKAGLSAEDEKAFNRSVEEKAAAMREEAKRRASSYR